MLAVVLKVLSILGIILLSLLGIFLAVCLLVLFVPISYRVTGHKNESEMVFRIRVNWLFHLIRASFDYPEPGILKVKALFFTVFDSQKNARKPSDKAADADKEKKMPQKGLEAEESTVAGTETEAKNGIKTQSSDGTGKEPEKRLQAEEEFLKEDGGAFSGKASLRERLFAKIDKLKYTIRTICDRIKEIRDNISYYKRLWEREETKALFRHAFMRIGKVLKGIRPRKLKCSLIYGASSPDVTGYLYAVYGILCPYLGNSVSIVPDFTQTVLEGELDASGSITVFRVAWNGLMLLLDKRLHLLRRRLRAHNAALKRKKQTA